LLSVFPAFAQSAPPDGVASGALSAQHAQPCDHYNAQRQPFFGDLHVHTVYSLDGNTQGTRTTPAQAYRFARGARIGIQPWNEDGTAQRSLQLEQPLDFAMVSDHAELIGEVRICTEPGVPGHDAWQCRMYRSWPKAAYYLFNAMASLAGRHTGLCGADDALCLDAALAPWQEMQRAARDNTVDTGDCAFTAFVGYEWTGLEGLSGGNLHRNVVFRNAAVPTLPISFIDERSPEDLWRALDNQCNEAGTGCESLVIPHNSNISAGFMFPVRAANGSDLSPDYARTRMRHEPVVEIVQHKGASECFYQAGVTNDELCAFEQLPIDNIAGRSNPPAPDTGFVRRALADGLQLAESTGENPYQFGFIGSTDTHLGAPGAADEGRFLGHGGAGDSAREEVSPGLPDKLEYNPGGLAVIWAEQNTRDSLFEALKRRETYATSGPRIVTRLFGGWDLDPALCDAPDRVEQAYARGVPMGSELRAAPDASAAPTLLVSAQRSADTAQSRGMPLQRVQVIKGWVNADGSTDEMVYDVAGDPDNGASVNLSSCATSGAGFSQLCTVWRDPAFDPDQRAFYYARVVENPSCRWSQRLCVAAGVDCSRPDEVPAEFAECCSAEHRPVVQERAWTSPLWYSPPPSLTKE
jgi:hypothetical protein